MAALSSHRRVLEKNLDKTRKLIKTIDKTIEHLRGTKKMKEQDWYDGFNPEKQAEYEKQIIDRFGEQGKAASVECGQNMKNWSKTDWENVKKEFDGICVRLTELLEKHSKANSKEVQSVIRRHYQMLKRFWTPTRESYAAHGKFIEESDLRKPYETFHPQLPKYIAEAIQVFAKTELC